MKLQQADFIGTWRIAREITDLRILESGTLEGEASFTQSDGCLHYRECGKLRFAGGAPVTAERQYKWFFTEDHVSVTFADGAPFHTFALTGAPTASDHLCVDDLYKANYAFHQWPNWKVVWSVKGPRKNYTSTTKYNR